MDNKEINTRLTKLTLEIVKRGAKINNITLGPDHKIAAELELMNMSLVGITAMLGEIAKRLPEPKEEES